MSHPSVCTVLLWACLTLSFLGLLVGESQVLGTVVHYVGTLVCQFIVGECYRWLSDGSNYSASKGSNTPTSCMTQEQKRVRFDTSLVTPVKFRYITLLVNM